jgi:hypothetical protein
MNEDYDLIIMGLSRWDNLLNSSVLNIAKEYSKSNRVFYIDRPFSFKDYYLKKEDSAIKRKSALLDGEDLYQRVEFDHGYFTAVTPRLSWPINFLPEGKLYDLVLNYNLKKVGEVIEKIIKDFEIKNYIFLNSFIPEYFEVIPKNCVQPLLKIYRSSDDISQEEYIARHGVRKEREAIEKADIVLTTSFGLKEKLERIQKPVHRIPNAAEFKLFERPSPMPSIPNELINAKGKIMFLSGNISGLRIDYELIGKICQRFSNDTLLIVGPYSQKDFTDHGLEKYKNLILTGAKRVEQLQSYLAYSQCALIPFLLNTLTFGIYPLKINEYLASGLPVISTNFSEDIASFGEVIYLAESHEDFLVKVKTAMNENSEEKAKKRIQVSLQNNWGNRVGEIKRLVAEKIQANSF